MSALPSTRPMTTPSARPNVRPNKGEQQRIDTGMRSYLITVTIWYAFMGVSLLLAPTTTSAIARLTHLTPFANPTVIGWSFVVVAAILYQTLIRPDWLGFRRFALILLMAHSIGYIGLAVLISLQTGLDWSRPVGWGYITAIHVITIKTTYDTRNPLSRTELSLAWGELRATFGALLERMGKAARQGGTSHGGKHG